MPQCEQKSITDRYCNNTQQKKIRNRKTKYTRVITVDEDFKWKKKYITIWRLHRSSLQESQIVLLWLWKESTGVLNYANRGRKYMHKFEVLYTLLVYILFMQLHTSNSHCFTPLHSFVWVIVTSHIKILHTKHRISL